MAISKSRSSRQNPSIMTNETTLLDRMPPPIRTRELPEVTRSPLRPLVIGAREIGFPVVQAALSGYSDHPMRLIARQMGASYTLAEVMIDRFVMGLKSRHRTRHHLYLTDEEHPVGGQLMGSDPEAFGPAAQRLVEAGFDVIDINFGCPLKTAVGGCRGGYHLGQPEVALEIVSRTRDAVPSHIPVTLKMRRGDRRLGRKPRPVLSDPRRGVRTRRCGRYRSRPYRRTEIYWTE